MPKRSITDEEIALIKALLDRGLKNKDIQFFFNRPDRSVNSGRITGIRQGKYANSKDVAPASAQVTDAFLAKHSAAGASGSIVVPAAPNIPAQGPMSAESLIGLFEEVGVGLEWRLKAGETDEHECKANFGFKFAHHWLRPIAGLANNRGGYVLFGVHDKGKKADDGSDLSHIVCGLSNEEFNKIDPAEFASKIKSTFDPTPRFQVGSVSVGGKTVGVIHVESHPGRPVIATRQESEIREGDIYFRYPGQTARIKYSDLRALLDDRDKSVRGAILPMVERLLALGPSRAMIADLESGTLNDGNRTIQIDEALLSKISFIKEGSFDEKDGFPALRLIGDVQSTGKAPPVHRGVVTLSDVIHDFLNQSTVLDPKEYIRFGLEGTGNRWLPIRYFAVRAKMTRSELVGFINKTKALPDRKRQFIGRVGKKSAARQKAGGKSSQLLKALLAGEDLPAPKTSKEAGNIARAILDLPSNSGLKLSSLLPILSACNDRATNSDASLVRRAMCRLDELFFELK